MPRPAAGFLCLRIARKSAPLLLVLLFGLFLTLAAEYYTRLDTAVSDLIFDFNTGSWPITPQLHRQLSPIFYEGAKHFVAFVGTSCVIYILCSFKKTRYRRNCRAALTILLCTILVPTIVGQLKRRTNIYCPNQLIRYNAGYPYVKVFENYPADFAPEHPGHCFPGGHITGAAALMSVCFLFRRRKNRLAVLFCALGFSCITGTYQLLRGEHFISHNLTSLFIAALVMLLIRALLTVCFARLRKTRLFTPPFR